MKQYNKTGNGQKTEREKDRERGTGERNSKTETWRGLMNLLKEVTNIALHP